MRKIQQDQKGAIGRNIRRLRLNCKLTQDGVVTQMQLMGCDLSRSVYSQIECGTYNIKASELAALKVIFKTDYNAFFEGVEEELLNNGER